MPNLKPLNDHVIVKAITEEVSASGIIIPETAEKDRPERGEVVAIGPGKLLETGVRAPIDVKPGDKIVFKKYSPDEIKVGKEEFWVIRNEDIVAVIEN
ncbi:MAG: co-chaperone GroES [Patescibacteria group bacterium]